MAMAIKRSLNRVGMGLRIKKKEGKKKKKRKKQIDDWVVGPSCGPVGYLLTVDTFSSPILRKARAGC